MMVFLALGTLYLYRQKLSAQDTLEPLIKIQRSSANNMTITLVAMEALAYHNCNCGVPKHVTPEVILRSSKCEK